MREALGIGFPGGTYEHMFYVADVEASGATMNGELHVALDRTDFLVVFPLKGERRARLIGTVREGEIKQQREEMTWEDVSKRVLEWIRIDVETVNWFSTYRVHHRVADHFRKGRAFLLGDAAHIHSPVGGQGMNTGIGDAVNLGWKLAAVVGGRAHASILDSYEQERIGFARQLVATTDRAFTGVTSTSICWEPSSAAIADMLLANATTSCPASTSAATVRSMNCWSSWTTTISSGGTEKYFTSPATGPPETFMYVRGRASTTLRPASLPSATSELTSEAEPPYLAMYSLTICWLSALGEPPYQPLGTKMPFSLPLPTALTYAAPWSGPAVAMKNFGL